MSCPDLISALGYGDSAQGEQPPFDLVMMVKILVIQAAPGSHLPNSLIRRLWGSLNILQKGMPGCL